VCLITNRTFLAGHPYAGLRRMLRRRFDTIDIIDLRGDSRGARPAGIVADECVFAIQVGVCVLIAAAGNEPRSSDSRAVVRYADVWRHAAVDSRAKLDLLKTWASDQFHANFVRIERADLDDFLPAPFEGLDYQRCTKSSSSDRRVCSETG
jgi:predicted helicase